MFSQLPTEVQSIQKAVAILTGASVFPEMRKKLSRGVLCDFLEFGGPMYQVLLTGAVSGKSSILL